MSQSQEQPINEAEAPQQSTEQDEKARRLAAARAKAEQAKAAAAVRRASQVSSNRALSEHGDSRGNSIVKQRPSAQSSQRVSPQRATSQQGSKPISKQPSKQTSKQTSKQPTPQVTPARSQQHMTPEEELEEIHRQIAAMEHDNQSLEERLQLYSEVIALRKELAVVQADEDRLRQQVANTETIIAAHDPEVAKEVAVLEDEAQQSSLHKIWAEECQLHNPDKMEWSNIDIANLTARVEAAREKFTSASSKAEELYAHQEEKINEHTDARERTKASLLESFEEEMGNLREARDRLRQVESEQQYHHKRGTTRRPKQDVIPAEKKTISRQRRVDDAEARTTAQVDAMRKELTELMEECKLLKKQLDDSKKIQAGKMSEYNTTLEEVEAEGAEARDMKSKLEKEKDELTALKSDLQGVLHYARAKNREEEDF